MVDSKVVQMFPAASASSTSFSGLEGGYWYKGWAGPEKCCPGAWSTSIYIPTPTSTNNEPTFSTSSTTRSVVENSAAGTSVGAAVTATDSDNDTLMYSLEGTDAASFDIVESSGQIQTKSGITYDHEASKNSYSVTVSVHDGKDADGNGDTSIDDMITVTISITDEDEPPNAPTALSVSAVSGSTTSLSVTWTAPSNTGRPPITSYDLQYRKGNSGAYTGERQNVTGTSDTIPNLDENSEYQVQVRATNDEGDGPWSSPGSGHTNAVVVPPVVDPTVTISADATSVTEGQSITFTVTASNLSSGSNYTVRVTTNNSNIGFNSGCTDRQTDVTVQQGSTSYSGTFTLHGCAAGNGTVKAALRLGTTELDSDSQSVSVTEPAPTPQIAISGLADTIELGSSYTFTVAVSNLVSTNTYAISMTTSNNGNAGFEDSCTDGDEVVPVPAQSASHSTRLTLYGCAAGTETVWAAVVSGATEFDSDSHTVTVNTPTPTNNRPTKADDIGDQTLTVGDGSTTIGLSDKFSDPDSDTLRYTASSLDTGVVTASVSGSSLEITPVSAGTSTVTVTAHDRGVGVSGGLSVSQSFRVTVSLPVPAAPTGLKSTPGDGTITLDWDDVDYAAEYIVYQWNGVDWPALDPNDPNSAYPITFSGSKAVISGLTNGVSYSYRVAAKNKKYGDTGDVQQSPDSAQIHTTPQAKLATPMNLDVEPMSLRRAKLTWTGDPNAVDDSNLADDYQVRVRKTGTTKWESPNLREQSGNSAIIILDIIWHDSGAGDKGMADLGQGESYEYQVRAFYDQGDSGTMDATDPYIDSDYSESVRIIDNPLLMDGGRALGSNGTADLKWKKITNAAHYIVEYRRLGSYSYGSSETNIPHYGHDLWAGGAAVLHRY